LTKKPSWLFSNHLLIEGDPLAPLLRFSGIKDALTQKPLWLFGKDLSIEGYPLHPAYLKTTSICSMLRKICLTKHT